MENSKNIEIAHHQSFQSFLTSYLIGCQEQKMIKSADIRSTAPAAFESTEDVLVLFDILYIPVIATSLTGFHSFSDRIFEKLNEEFVELTFYAFILRICSLEKADPDAEALFQGRVAQSLETMSVLIEEKQEELKEVSNLNFSFKSSESSLVFGHFSHPYPKLQELRNQEESLKDLNKELSLKWCLVHKKILHVEASKYFTSRIIEDVLQETLECEWDSDHVDLGDYFLYPVHPLQFNEFHRNELLKKYYETNLIIPLDLKRRKSRWTPTTSMRSIYNDDSKWMLKFSLPVRLTNSIRTLQTEEVKRGMQLHEVFTSNAALDIKKNKETSFLSVIHEPFFMALKDDKDQILKNSIVVFRENPFHEEKGPFICLASLNQFSPVMGKPFLCHLIEEIAKKEEASYETVASKWFFDFLERAIFPFVYLQGREGIYLGAHQQNLILKLSSQNYPEASYYRDCQGSGYSHLGYEKFKDTAESLQNPNGNVLDTQFANSLIGYYLFINSTLFSIKTIARGDKVLEKALINGLTEKLKRLTGLLDTTFIDYILNSECFLIKDNFECCLKGINENTIDNPLKIYKKFKNPFYTGAL